MSFFFLIAQIILHVSSAKAEAVISQTIGTSAFQVVTSREVKAMELISRSLEKEMKNSSFEISEDQANRVLFEIAIYRESQSLAALKANPDEISELVVTVKSRLQKNPDWKKLDVSDAELKNWVEREKVALDYMKLKASSLTTIITDQEIQDYYEKNRVKFGSTPLQDQKNNIRFYLQKESQKQRVQEWLAALKTKYQIRNDFADMAAPQPMQAAPAAPQPAALNEHKTEVASPDETKKTLPGQPPTMPMPRGKETNMATPQGAP
jgi:hypothetical protein